ncbi:MAG: phenylacetic acid degradation bifunctional protein PaaZ [Saprospiraceae bacterium]|nr:phenylacetic acid degradation bifunctional protein PaaZ [Saprospiraceae bacterium]MDG2419753.1 phenylacetic acid degradation bifunctional protein PaaZ [Saprospiraceae bacterium]
MKKLKNYALGSWIQGEGEGSPLYNSVTGEIVAMSTTKGLDFGEILEYGRRKGGAPLRKMTFQERGNMLKKLALYLTKRKEQFYEVSYKTGATRADSWVDIEGGFGNLFSNASLRKNFANQTFHVDGDFVDISRGGSFAAQHIMVPKRGVAIHINAYNFPVWGMLEKCATNWMAGVPAVVKPATATSFLTEAVVREIIDSGILPEGALQLICGSARTILDRVDSQDVVTFTGSASTGQMLKAHPRIISESVPFNMEADSLNCSVLGEKATPDTPEFDLFIKEVRKEMTSKCGQKCTAIRRIIVPEYLVEDVKIALGKQLGRIGIGNPTADGVRMGALASRDQVIEVRERVKELAQTAEIVYGSLDKIDLIDADYDKGAFLSPILLLEKNPYKNLGVHEIEAFGPVSTIMPYKGIEQAVELAQMGKGSLCASIATFDDAEAREFVVGAASHHGRILVLNRENAKQSTGHGSPLPTLVHGGPGRAGGGEEMGGMRGINHYLQRCAVQGTPTTLSAITGIYQPNAKVTETPQHPFKYYFEEIEPGMSLLTHKRTITNSDIQNFANLTWDVFYAHTDITSLDGTIFEKRAAHGYFLLAAAAGLFVHPAKGPVGANYGLDNCRFIRPIYHDDTIQVRLTCKEKVERDSRGKEHPSGVVKWYEEIFDQDGELVAMATILTLVQKKSPFPTITKSYLQGKLNALAESTQPKWGKMTAQHLVEHMEFFTQMALGNIETEITTPEKYMEKTQDSLWDYRSMLKEFDHPALKKGEVEDLRFGNLEEAKDAFWKAYEALEIWFKENPKGTVKNTVFGWLTKYEFQLLNRKHWAHHLEQFGV